ncbi:B12D protein [Euphorbia peplus]|nr:B12D protein [Euphorbia peplus]
MGRWLKPEVYPLVGAMSFVGGMLVFSLSRHAITNPDVRIHKSNRQRAVLENREEGEKYAEHSLRRFLRTRPPQVMPAINNFFSKDN